MVEIYRLVCVLVLATAAGEINAYQCTASKEGPIVTTPSGTMRGTQEKTQGKGITCKTFRGIPFAEPPVGDLRFAAPEPSKKISCTLDATKEAPLCTQGSKPNIIGQEDCLYLNVYTPDLSENANLPVMVFFHGGGYNTGNTTYKAFGPDYFLNEGIVFVSANSRLGIFGFLSTGDTIAPGNNGLKDNVAALKWVKENIKSFGGDPSKVTIAGQGTGASSVSYHMLSKQSKRLFRSAIMQSGSSLCLFSFSRTSRRLAFELGKQLKVNATNSAELVEGLKQINVEELQDAANQLNMEIFKENALAGIPLAPVQEPNHRGAFLTQFMYESFKRGNYNKVPTIVGVNKNETATQTDPLIVEVVKLLKTKYIDKNYSLLTPADLTSNPAKRRSIGFQINYALTRTSLNAYDFLNYDQYRRPIYQQILQTSQYSPVYAYVFRYEEKEQGILATYGVELEYLFRSYKTQTEKGDQVRDRMVRMWANFIKGGNPTPVKDPVLQNVIWPKVKPGSNNIRYISIGEDLTTSMILDNVVSKFYDRIYSQDGDHPFNTY